MFQTSECWIQTYSGLKLTPLNIQADQIKIVDIAHALSLLCRFNGHCTEFYSVAQHSVCVSKLVPTKFALWGLLHDASESILSDIASPVKRELLSYKELENTVMLAICRKYGLSEEMPQCVKHADLIMLATEKRDLMLECSHEWLPMPAPMDVTITPWLPYVAEYNFLRRFYDLTGN